MGKSHLNDFVFGIFIGRFASDGAAIMAVKGLREHTCIPATSVFDSPITNRLSTLRILIEIISHAHVQGGKKGLYNSNLTLLLVVFRVTARQAWQ